MARVGAIFVALCMVLIAGSLGALLYLYLGLSGAESAVVALAAFAGLAIYNATVSRVRDRGDVATRLDDLSRGTADLARQVTDLGRRMAVLENRFDGVLDRAGEATRPLADEIGELGNLVTHLAEMVAAHDTVIQARMGPGSPSAASAPAAAEAASDTPVVVAPPSVPAAPAEVPVVPAAPAVVVPAPVAAVAPSPPGLPKGLFDGAPGGAFEGLTEAAAAAIVREAIDANRIDLLLQPIVMLPQRKVRYYEVMARLRTEDGEVITPADFLPVAEANGLIARLDNAMLFRGIQVVRRLLGKSRDVGLFCNVSAATLVDPEFFPQFAELADANRALAPAFVFEFRQDAYRTLGPIENESLAALAERGFRFSLDHVADLRLEPRDLAERGFRFVKVPAAILLDRTGTATTDIHPADLAGLLGRYGVELIAERIETEATVVDLLDYDVKFGQGFLFSPPRPVRPEVLQGVERRTEAIAAPAPEPAVATPAPVRAAATPLPVAAVPTAAPAVPAVPAERPATSGAGLPPAPTSTARSTPPLRGAEPRRPPVQAGTVLAQIARGMLARK